MLLIEVVGLGLGSLAFSRTNSSSSEEGIKEFSLEKKINKLLKEQIHELTGINVICMWIANAIVAAFLSRRILIREFKSILHISLHFLLFLPRIVDYETL